MLALLAEGRPTARSASTVITPDRQRPRLRILTSRGHRSRGAAAIAHRSASKAMILVDRSALPGGQRMRLINTPIGNHNCAAAPKHASLATRCSIAA